MACLFAVDAANGAVAYGKLFVFVVFGALAGVFGAEVGSATDVAANCVSFEGADGCTRLVSKAVASCALKEGWSGLELANDYSGTKHAYRGCPE
jgi:hypothetical protein